MLRALAILLLLLLTASPALAQESARFLSTGVACWQSNAIAWEPATDPNGDALIYEVYRERPDGDWELCGQTVLTSLRLAGTPCYGRLAVRACDPGGLCSPHLSAPVEAWPCSCIACGTPECGPWLCTCPDAYEYPCWESAPLRLPHLPTGPPPVIEPELVLAPRAWGSYGGEVAPGPPRWASWAAVGAIALDYWTTRQALDRGAREASPLGPEGGVVLRLGIVWAADRWAARRPGTAVELTIAGASLAAAIHNHGVNR